MKKILSIMLGLSIAAGAFTLYAGQDTTTKKASKKTAKTKKAKKTEASTEKKS